MRLIGFSTGALARGDFRHALDLLAGRGVRAIELSALRETELPTLMAGLADLDLSQYEYVSVHAPSRLQEMSEAVVAESLHPCIDREWSVVLHPDVIRDHSCWRDFGALLCIENMDKRKDTGRNAGQLARHFEKLPEASLCLDLGHARQVDATMAVARQIIRDFGGRLTQIHLSEVDSACRHEPLSLAAVWAMQEIARHLPECPVILESVVPPERIDSELRMAARCFQVTAGSRTLAGSDAFSTG